MTTVTQAQEPERRSGLAAVDFANANLFGLTCAILMLFAFFFMPWAGNTLQQNGARMMADSLVGPYPEFFTYEPVTILLIPFAALMTLLVSLWGLANIERGRLVSYLTTLAGVLALVYFANSLTTISEGPVHTAGAGVGFWVTAFASLGLIGQLLFTQPAVSATFSSGGQALGAFLPSIPRKFVPYLFLLAPLLLYLVWIIGPTIYTFYLSVTNWDGVSEPLINGLYNYERLFGFGRFVVEDPGQQLLAALSNNLGALALALGLLGAVVGAAHLLGNPEKREDTAGARRALYGTLIRIAVVAWLIAALTFRPDDAGLDILVFVVSNLPLLIIFLIVAFVVAWMWHGGVETRQIRILDILFLITVLLWFVATWIANPGRAAGNFVVALTNNARWLAVFITVPTTLGLGLALVFNNEMRGGRWYKVSFYGPLVLSFPVIGLVWAWIYNPRLGLINSFLTGIGIEETPGWLADQELAIWCIIIAAVWRQVGYVMVLYLAGLKNIDPTLVEAAVVDGANRWDLFRRVVLPLLAPVTTIVIVISIIDSLRSFDLVQIMTRGNTGTEVLANLMYMEAFNNYEMGYGAAIAVVLFAISLVFIGFYLRRTVRDELEY